MAVTLTNRREGVDSFGRRYVEVDVTFDASYPTGGEVVTRASLGLAEVTAVETVAKGSPIRPDKTAHAATEHGSQLVAVLATAADPKLKLIASASTEASNGSDQTGVTERVRFIGQ